MDITVNSTHLNSCGVNAIMISISSEEMPMKKPTIKIIAKDAGVSEMTVSRVINNPELVSEATVKKVLKSMEKYNYKPKMIAKILKGRKSKTVGFLISSRQEFYISPFYGECIRSAATALKDFSLRTLSFNLLDTLSKSLFVDYANSGLLDGMIIFEGTFQEDITEVLRVNNIPFVYVGETFQENSDIVSISSDSYEGARKGMKYLIDTGSKNICFVTGTGSKPSYIHRKQAYLDAISEANLEYQNVIETERSMMGGMLAAEKLIKQKEEINAVFCFCDVIAIGVIKRLQEKGITIPKEIRVLGFDNIPFAKYTTPALTTIAQDTEKMGMIAANSLLKLMFNEPLENTNIIVPTELIIREST